MNTKMYVGNLSFDCSDQELTDLFSESGPVDEVNIIMDKFSGRPRGFAFVTMQNADDAAKAIDSLNEQDFLGRKLVVREAYDDREKTGNRSGGGHRNSDQGGFKKRGGGGGFKKRSSY